MADSEIVTQWLGSAARRIRMNRRAEYAVRMLATLLFVMLSWQLVRLTIGSVPIQQALFPLFVLSGAAALIFFVWQMFVTPDHAQAAVVVDVRAGLNNELTSALWFSAAPEPDAFTRAHVARAAQTVAHLDVLRVIPFLVPRQWPVLPALLLAGIAVFWLGSGGRTTEQFDAGPAASSRANQLPTRARYGDDMREAEPLADERIESAWLKVEQLAHELRAGPDTDRIVQAIAERDAKSASRLLAGMRREQSAQAATGKAARPETEQMSETLATSIVERLQNLLDRGSGGSNGDNAQSEGEAAERMTEQVTRDLRQEMDDAQSSAPGEMSPEEQILNTALQAMSRESRGGAEQVRGEANPMQGLGRTSVGSGAMGRRISQSTGGAGDGEEPTGNPQGSAEAEPVLGLKTTRLQLQMQTVKIDQVQQNEAGGNNEESFYAATQAQAAKTSFEEVVAEQQGGNEQVTGSDALPLAYRDAVKQYTVQQHQRERSGGNDAETQ